MRMSEMEREGHVVTIESHIGEEVEIRSKDGRLTEGTLMLLCGETRRWAIIESKRMVRPLHINEVADTAELGGKLLILASRNWCGRSGSE